MDLEQQQQSLLELLKCRSLSSQEDEYLRTVRESHGLAMSREVAVWWRSLGLQRNAPHTCGLLKRLRRYDELLNRFYCENAVSPYMEVMAEQFLSLLANDSDSLVACVARFELAVMQSASEAVVECHECHEDFDRDPGALLDAIQYGRPLPEPDGMTHELVIARNHARQEGRPAIPGRPAEAPATRNDPT